ncbi:MAG: transposase [Proteobacteria bacterium]|nr:transposase [Pseudomonadota bacterium]
MGHPSPQNRHVQYFNREYQRTGTLWEGRYKASLVEAEQYFLTCSRYIELNPVRARMVDYPAEYPWSSYRHNGLGMKDLLLTCYALFEEPGLSEEQRRAAYRSLFDQRIDEKMLTTIRDSTQRGWALGSRHFLEQIGSCIKRPAQKSRRGGDRRSKIFREESGFNRN